TFLGEASQVTDAEAAESLREAFVAAHPRSELWAGFADFKPYRLNCRNLHFVAGFGRIAWLSPDRVIQHL
ncbi:MAG: pyridoxamine 5'-phosphate oxidase, partial [Rhodospirillales bacterium]|nr:pyridoxamine 5'-phosphate oxidase [Rhodospirillales bacterium]